MSSVIPFPPPNADEHAKAETERKQKLFEWADRLLAGIGLADRVKQANSLDELRKIVLDTDAAEIELAIREAMHPTSGVKADFLDGLGKGAIKQILKMRFRDMKTEREAQLRRPGGSQSQPTSNWTDDLKFDAKGGIKPILNNLTLFLTHHPDWKGVFAFDEFGARVVISKRPPSWEQSDTFTDHHEARVRMWFQREDIIPGQGDVGRAVQVAARSNPIHPVREYLDALKWDGTPRLDKLFVDYFHAENTPYVRAVGPRFAISAVARIFQPGCKVDHLPILEGPQGKLKSEAVRTLAVNDAWFTDRLSHVASKDAAIETAGVWLIEIAEMEALTRASSSSAKGFVTRRIDRFRPPYGKHTIPLRRQCVFVGTINPPVGGYLRDSTGARRFWPVACDDMIDIDNIKRDRDQLWAEAVHRFKANEVWWLETPKLEALAKAEQDARFKVDVWQEPIKQWLGSKKDVSIGEVLEGALEIEARDQTRSAEMRVANILTHLGFAKYRPNKGGKRQNRYHKHKE